MNELNKANTQFENLSKAKENLVSVSWPDYAGCRADWYRAIHEFKYTMDGPENYESDEIPLKGSAIVRLLCRYASELLREALTPDDLKLAVIVWPPSVWFCLSTDGLHGSFVQPYDNVIHGEITCELDKGMNIWNYSNIEAMRDGWHFHATMLSKVAQPTDGSGRQS